ncbi:hypothetical protein ACFLS1_04785 [Verrucomicrobiota bacterium]
MKVKYLFLVAFLVVAVVAMQVCAQEVSTVNVVGFNRITVPPASYVMVGLQLDSVNGETNTLAQIFGTNTLRSGGGGDPAQSDVVWMWNTSQTKYDKYMMGPDFKYYNIDTWAEESPDVVPGQAFWIQSPSLGSYSSETNSFSFVGQIVNVITQSTDVVLGWQQMAYGFSSEPVVNELDFDADGATGNGDPSIADQIWFYDPLTTSYTTYFLGPDGNWYDKDTFALATGTVDMGQGFWYVARAGFTWSETNKYIGGL